MSKTEHTPGPWHYTNQLIFKDGICIAETFSRQVGMDAVANARLIAAAPALLAACEEGEKRLAFLQRKVVEAGLVIVAGVEIRKTADCIKFMKEAIAKTKAGD